MCSISHEVAACEAEFDELEQRIMAETQLSHSQRVAQLRALNERFDRTLQEAYQKTVDMARQNVLGTCE